MENYQNQYGATRRTTGEYGTHTDPAVGQQVDEYGNPIIHPSAAPGYGAAGTTTTGVGLHHGKEAGHHGIAGKLHGSGGSSSSSSSSEDDGYGGRRKKKGLKQKIKEKIPGVHSSSGEPEHPQATSTTTPGGYHSADEPHHKKGVMEKIKDKVTGTHHNY
ncbi:unnamed protein product [Linum tenue]|uniref:Dehydrin n=1 Tax=Linum tenue TaxID=586396 RepID=A0AAV0JK40_9ROSI|nr:unnamed protein product [Linum tenue]